VNEPPRILVVDDNPTNRDILDARLQAHGYAVLQAADGEQALRMAAEQAPDVVLLDVMMPKLDGFEVCRRLKRDAGTGFMPVILVTARAESKDVVAGLDAGADEYLAKPVDQAALLARIRSMLRIKQLHEKVQAQAGELANWNRVLEARVASQVSELERMARLRRFLPPQVAEIVASAEEKALDSHRRDVTVVFCDLRGFTAFSESAEPEEVMQLLGEYHEALGRLVQDFQGTLERFTGDGIMVFFNDPFPCPDPCGQAVRMALEMRRRVGELAARWKDYGHELGFGVGIAHGYATLGRVGFDQRFDYAAVGSVVNLAARLCGEAHDGEILVDRKVHAAVHSFADTQSAGELSLKGFQRPVPAFKVRALREAAAAATSRQPP
jgi:class 3 adenylate cyclase